MQKDFQVLVTSSDGTKRRRFPYANFAGATWSIERYGGYADFTIQINVDFAANPVTSIQIGDRVEFYYLGVRRFRGYIQEIDPTEDEPPKIVLSGYGVSFWLGKAFCQQRWVFPDAGVDVAAAFGLFAQKTLIPSKMTGGARAITIIDCQNIGTTSSGVDGYNKQAGDVLTDLVKQSGNLAVWGGDVAPDGTNRAFFRPFQSLVNATHVLPVPSLHVEAASGAVKAGDVFTVLFLTGGQDQYPQLLYNGNFEAPILAEDPTGSLILNGDFEHGGFHVADNWTFSPGATTESGKSSPPAHVAAFTGTRYLELDTAGEQGVQLLTGLTFTAGHNYLLEFRACKEISLQVLSGHVLWEILNAAGATIASVTIPVVPPDDSWSYFQQTMIPPTGGVGTRVTLVLDSITAYGGQQGGLCFDAVGLYDADVAYQDGWILQPQNAVAKVNAVNWQYAPAPEGAYCVYGDVTAANADGQDLQLRPPDGSRMSCQPGQQLRFSGFFNSPPISANNNFPIFYMEIDWFQSGTYVHRDRTLINLAAGGRLAAWTEAEIVATCPSNANQCDVTITFRSAGSFLADKLSLRDASAPSPLTTDYLPQGPFTLLIRASDTRLPAGNAYANAESVYGTLVGTATESSVLRLADALIYANAYFNLNAQPSVTPQLSITNDPRVYLPGETLRLEGKDGKAICPLTLPIIRVSESYDDGILRCRPELTRELPDVNLAIQQIIKDELARLGPNYSGSSGGGSGGGSGSGGGAAGVIPPQRRVEEFVSDGATLVYTLKNAPSAGSLTIFAFGLMQKSSSTNGIKGWAFVGSVVTINNAPANGQELIFDYMTIGSNGIVA